MISHSKISTFVQCPYKYKLRYVDEIQTLPDYSATNPLTVGTALHTGIETSVENAIEQYYGSFPTITDEHVEECVKLEAIINKCRNILPVGGEFEHKIICGDFIGFIDYLIEVEKGVYDIYDFKYSNGRTSYMKSGQLHEYKYYLEKSEGVKVRKLFYLFAPKINIHRGKIETVEAFRTRLRNSLSAVVPEIVEVRYDQQKVLEFQRSAEDCENCCEFVKKPSRLCEWCEYNGYCQKGESFMLLPKNERKPNEMQKYKKMWLYGLPFSGKTYLANQFKNVLMLNTDGNIKYIDAPYISIKDSVSVDGRMTRRVFAWDIFKDTVAELEKKQNDFDTVVVDLLEDVYEHCRLWCYNHLGIEHESDNSFKAWDFVRTEFLSTIKRLLNLEYNIILISHEDSSKDITKKTGDKITAIKPNIAEKVALKVAGMVDIVGRIINDDGNRTISFKSNEVIFGGGRLNLKALEVPCTYEALMGVYGQESPRPAGNIGKAKEMPVNESVKPKKDEPQVTMSEEKPKEEETPAPATTPRRTRRVRA